MYARLVLFNIGPGKRSTADKLVEQFAPAIKARKGFKSATFFGDEASGEYGVFVLWETEEDAEAAAKALFPKLQQSLANLVKEPPRNPLFEVVKQV